MNDKNYPTEAEESLTHRSDVQDVVREVIRREVEKAVAEERAAFLMIYNRHMPMNGASIFWNYKKATKRFFRDFFDRVYGGD